MDLVRYGLTIDRVPDSSVLDLEGTVRVEVEIISARSLDNSLMSIVAGAVRIEVAPGHWYGFIVDESVLMAVDHGVDT